MATAGSSARCSVIQGVHGVSASEGTTIGVPVRRATRPSIRMVLRCISFSALSSGNTTENGYTISATPGSAATQS